MSDIYIPNKILKEIADKVGNSDTLHGLLCDTLDEAIEEVDYEVPEGYHAHIYFQIEPKLIKE